MVIAFKKYNSYALRISTLLAIMLCFFVLPQKTKANQSSSVIIKAQVNFNITLKVYPEKRIPLVNHWMNQNVIDIRNVGSTTPLVTQVVEFDQDGVGILSPIDPAVLPPGYYDIAVKGYSHLRDVYENYYFLNNTALFDLTFSARELKAGDMNNDNYVNSLDLSHQIINLYGSSNIRSDVNRDGIVNSLDISNTTTNLYEYGKN